jgi:hypothetical protein
MDNTWEIGTYVLIRGEHLCGSALKDTKRHYKIRQNILFSNSTREKPGKSIFAVPQVRCSYCIYANVLKEFLKFC